jgi:serine/threonine protein kinase
MPTCIIGAQAAAAGLQRPSGIGLATEASGVMGTSFYISPEIEQVREAPCCQVHWSGLQLNIVRAPSPLQWCSADDMLLRSCLQGKASHDERVDLFSAGVTVFELFRPFATGTVGGCVH